MLQNVCWQNNTTCEVANSPKSIESNYDLLMIAVYEQGKAIQYTKSTNQDTDKTGRKKRMNVISLSLKTTETASRSDHSIVSIDHLPIVTSRKYIILILL